MVWLRVYRSDYCEHCLKFMRMLRSTSLKWAEVVVDNINIATDLPDHISRVPSIDIVFIDPRMGELMTHLEGKKAFEYISDYIKQSSDRISICEESTQD